MIGFSSPMRDWAALLVSCGCLMSQADAAAQFAFYEFSAREFRAAEDTGQATISISRSGNLNLDFSIDWFARGATAIAGIDFRGVTNTVHFAPGETNKIATIPLIDDGLLEEPEVISLGFGNPPIG